VVRRSGLGKGLGALIPADLVGDDQGEDGVYLLDIPVGQITPNPHQPRVHFDEESLAELSDSIRELGVLQPVLVRPGEQGGYVLIAGERRWRAARRAGLATVPAVVRPTDDLTSVEQALVENLHREDLTPLEEAAAYQQLIEDFQLTHEQVAVRVGKSRAAVSNVLRLLSLPPAIQHLLADGRLSAGHARALLTTPDRAFQEHVAKRASEEGWSVRAVEEAVRMRLQGETPAQPQPGESTPIATADTRPVPKPASTLRPPGLLELEELLAEHLATRVKVAMTGRRGKITIEFADLEDLERLYHAMVQNEQTFDS
jgi:ParB family transcriptional regulator, chromosome partitioning protein